MLVALRCKSEASRNRLIELIGIVKWYFTFLFRPCRCIIRGKFAIHISCVELSEAFGILSKAKTERTRCAQHDESKWASIRNIDLEAW